MFSWGQISPFLMKKKSTSPSCCFFFVCVNFTLVGKWLKKTVTYFFGWFYCFVNTIVDGCDIGKVVVLRRLNFVHRELCRQIFAQLLKGCVVFCDEPPRMFRHWPRLIWNWMAVSSAHIWFLTLRALLSAKISFHKNSYWKGICRSTVQSLEIFRLVALSLCASSEGRFRHNVPGLAK